MTRKKITFPAKPTRDVSDVLDAWVSGKETAGSTEQESVLLEKKPEAKAKKTSDYSRSTYIIPSYLHKRLKKVALVEDKDMSEKLTELLEKHLPEV